VRFVRNASVLLCFPVCVSFPIVDMQVLIHVIYLRTLAISTQVTNLVYFAMIYNSQVSDNLLLCLISISLLTFTSKH